MLTSTGPIKLRFVCLIKPEGEMNCYHFKQCELEAFVSE